MSPVITLIIGCLLVYWGGTGRIEAIWKASIDPLPVNAKKKAGR